MIIRSSLKRVVAMIIVTCLVLGQWPAMASVTGISNETIIYNFLRNELNLGVAASCGILANIYAESAFNPEALNPNDRGNTKSYGICQWNSGAGAENRYGELINWCNRNGYIYSSLEGQLQFMKHELESSSYYKLSTLRKTEESADGAASAALTWARFYEGCATENYAGRQDSAKNRFWPVYSGNPPSSPCTCSEAYAGNYTCTSQTTLNIRNGHSSSGTTVLGSIPGGATVYVSKASGTGTSDWGHVTYNGISGYVSMQYMSKNETPADLGTDFYAIILNKALWKPIYHDQDDYIRLRPEDGTASQVWYFVRKDDGSYIIRSARTGELLEMYNGDKTPGTPIMVHDDDWGSWYQQWFIYPQGDGYVLMNRDGQSADLVMDLENASSADGTPITTYPRNNSSAQIWAIYGGSEILMTAPTLSAETKDNEVSFQWTKTYGEAYCNLHILQDTYAYQTHHVDANVLSYTKELPAGTYTAKVNAGDAFRQEESNAVTVKVGQLDAGESFDAVIRHKTSNNVVGIDANYNVELQTETGKSDQIWHFQRLSNGSYEITPTSDVNRRLDDENAGSSLSNVWAAYGNGSKAQQWYLMGDSIENCSLFTVCRTGLCMDAENAGTAPGTNMQLYTANQSGAQMFHIDIIEDPIPLNADDITLTATAVTYNGQAQKPAVTVKSNGTTLVQGTDYTLTYTNNTNAGKATVTITGTGAYTGTITKTFTINKAKQTLTAQIETAELTVGDTAQITAKATGTLTYTSSNTGIASVDKNGLVTAVASGKATITVTAAETQNYLPATTTLSVTVERIALNAEEITLAATSFTYDGNVKTPAVTVKAKGTTLVQGTDYTVSYSNNTNAGKATVTITGTGAYTGTITKNFTINKAKQTLTAQIETTELAVGDTTQITAKATGALTYTSSNTSVASVDKAGLVTAVAPGKVTITVTAAETGNYLAASSTFTVTVKEKEPEVPESAPVIQVESVKGLPGQKAEVTISLANNPGLVAMMLNVHYDNSVMTLTEVKDLSVLGTKEHNPDLNKRPYTLSWSNDTTGTNFEVNGPIVTLVFTINEKVAEGSYPITVTYDADKDAIYDKDLNAVNFVVQNGQIKVVRALLGDVNGDGKVTNLDRACLARYLAGWDGYDDTTLVVEAMDVNADGKVSNLDRAVLARHLANWEGYETLPFYH